jgi:hypothetical protein
VCFENENLGINKRDVSLCTLLGRVPGGGGKLLILNNNALNFRSAGLSGDQGQFPGDMGNSLRDAIRGN